MAPRWDARLPTFLGANRREHNFRNRLAGIAHKSHGGLHGDGHALSRDNFQEGAVIKALDFQHGLVGLDFKKNVALGNGLAQLLAPVDDLDRLFRLP